MRRALVFLVALWGCGTDNFTGSGDSGPDVLVEEDARPDSADSSVDGGTDGVADAKTDVADVGPPLCAQKPAPVTGLDGDRCSAVIDPACSSPCAANGYACSPSVTAGDFIPEWLRPSCTLSTTDAGAGKTAYCCTPKVCVRQKGSDVLCTQLPARPYAYSCPTGTIALKNCGGDAGACNCNGTVDQTVQCCDLAGP